MTVLAGRIGVVAIGRNEGDRLRRCLSSIDIAEVPVIYVDSASTDGSRDVALALGAILVDLDMALPFTAARARNAGLERLLSLHPAIDYIQFIDGDCEIEQGWVSQAAAFLDTHDSAAVACGRRRERFPDASFYNRLCDSEWNTPVGETTACGGDALMRRTAILSAGGFRSDLAAGEEPELCHRLRKGGWTIWRLDLPMTIHDADMHNFRQWWKRAVRSGLGYVQAWHATRRDPSPLYRGEALRALIWTVGVALVAIIAASVIDIRLILIAPLLWAAQYLRLALSYGWRKGGLLLVGKAAESRGIATFLIRRLTGLSGGTIFYK